MAELRIGTSGWVYKHWREVFYPQELKARAWFEFYARHFGTVEINNSFYRLPAEATYDAWRRQAPPGFVYAVKANRFITHVKRLMDPEEPLATFIERTERLGPALGPILYQLPPRWHANLPRLEHFLSLLPERLINVVEFRDQSWLVEPVFELLERYHVAHCLHDMRPLQVPRRVTGGTVYVRFHGAESAGGDYAYDHLRSWAEQIAAWQREGLPVYAYFNNDPHGYALKNAATLKQLLGLGRAGAALGPADAS